MKNDLFLIFYKIYISYNHKYITIITRFFSTLTYRNFESLGAIPKNKRCSSISTTSDLPLTNIGPSIPSPYTSLTSRQRELSYKLDPSEKWSTSRNSRLAPLISSRSLRPHLKSNYLGGTGEAIIPTDYNCASRHQT